jgi:hypothetical protein
MQQALATFLNLLSDENSVNFKKQKRTFIIIKAMSINVRSSAIV